MWAKKMNICKDMFLRPKTCCLYYSRNKISIGDSWNVLTLYNLKKKNFCNEIKILNIFSSNYRGTKVKGALNKWFGPFSNKYLILENQTEKNFFSIFRYRTLHHIFSETRMMKSGEKCINKLLAQPKKTIQKFYEVLAKEFTHDKLVLSPVLKNMYYGHGTKLWFCEYKVKWPEQRTFLHVDPKKKKATHDTALAVVKFLFEKNVISSNGTPILCHKKVVNCSSAGGIRCFCSQSLKKSKKEKSVKIPVIKNNLEKDVSSESEIEYSKISQLFPTPKNTLGNVFQVVASEKRSREFTLSPSFKQSNNGWICTYKIKWPEEKSFSATAGNKQLASTKCSLLVLDYLVESNKITKKGVPIMYDKDDVKALVRSTVPTLYFNENHMEKVKKIVDLHTWKIFPILVNPSEKIKKIEDFADSSDDILAPYHQKYIGYNRYKSKEKIHLPVSDYKDKIIQMMKENRVLIVKGEPGCGKSTRIPQYILEGWAQEAELSGEPCRIVVTEPRRIAAISLAERVASERDEEVGSIVGYQVRFKSSFQPKIGRILYCTNGILLQHFKSDPNLSRYTHVVIDEAHERDINTDLLLNMLKNLLVENPSLKVVIMSATIDTSLFQNYFEGSALIHIPGFTYPVKSHFIDNSKLSLEKTKKMCIESKPTVIHEDVVKVLLYLHQKKPEGAILCFLPGWEDIRKIRDMIPEQTDLSVLCLHSRLQDSEQWKIFSKPPPGVRKIILSTNIAETSVTIDDVVYVVDTGIHKETTLDVDKGVMCIDNHWISQSSVEQRKGRAGRVRAGESFHLYPKSKLESLPEFSQPEILRVSLTKVVLDSKAYCKDVDALDFFGKLPSPPGPENVKLAVDELKDLELIDDKEKLTPLGEVVVDFQLEPKLSKTLVNSVVYKCVSPIVDIVTLFSSGTEIFASVLDRKEVVRSLKSKYSRTSDHLAMMRLFEIWEEFREAGDRRKADKFCRDLSLVPSRMNMLKALRNIHFDYLHDGLECRVLPISDDFSDEDEIVKAVLLSGVGSFLTYKNWEIVKGRIKKGGNVLLTRLNHKATVTPDSVNFKNTSLKSKFLLYINETRSNVRRTTLIRETSLISPLILLLFSNKKLQMHNINGDQFSPDLKSEDQVILNLAGTKLSFLLDRQQAVAVMQCKLALNSCYEHFIYELTSGGEHNPELNRLWDELLLNLSDLLNDFKYE